MKYPFQPCNVFSLRLRTLCFTLMLLAPAAVSAIDIADFPIEDQINEPPAALVFVLDDSGSMDSEFMTPEPNGRMYDAFYLFPDDAYLPANDHTFGTGHALDVAQRRDWRARWSGYNRLYYNPHQTYSPWPVTAMHSFGPADLYQPFSDPTRRDTDPVRCRMAATCYVVTDTTGTRIAIPHAHYFIRPETVAEAEPVVYLVTWQDGDIDDRLDLGAGGSDRRLFFRFNDNGNGLVEDNELAPVTDAAILTQLRPMISNGTGEAVRRTDAQDLQNFSNWFSYHRRREFVLKHVVAQNITRMRRMLVGFYALNAGPRIAVQPVYSATAAAAATTSTIDKDDAIHDRSEYLLDNLYGMHSEGDSPLRTALDQVGRYFDQSRVSDLGESPYWREALGGGCQRVGAVVITDGYWNDAFSGLGNVDGDQGPPYADGWSDTLADIAFYYYRKDLSAALPDGLSSPGCDQAPHQHMTTHTLNFGVTGTLDPTDIDGDGRTDDPGYYQDPCFLDSRTPHPVWPMPVADQPSVGDDVWHAAVNGRGIYFNADGSDALATALSGIVASAGEAAVSASSPAVQGAVFEAGSIFLQTRYRTDQWTGDLLALKYVPEAGESGIESGQVLWRAADRLNRPGISADSRRILTYGGIWSNPEGIALRYAELSSDQRSALGSDLVSGSSGDEAARSLVEYLRGREMAPFRRRASRLGDMVHSAPIVTGDTVFVGANDGMLHAFDVETGDERFAYVPHLVFSRLKHLAEPGYLRAHRFFVDATPSVGEVAIGEHRHRSYLVGGLGKGGRGYFCLRIAERHRSRSDEGFGAYQDVFSVDHIGAGTRENDIADLVQWEYPRPASDNDLMDNDGDGRIDENGESDPDMGYSFGRGYAVNANTEEDGYRAVVIFGNGYNSDRGHAVLYIMDAEKGTLIRKIDTGAGADNGLSVPALIDVDLDRRVDYAYAGDLKGNMWKFDLTSENPDRWGVAYGDDIDRDGRIDATGNDKPQPVFQAKGQPITGRPDVMRPRSICAADAPGYLVIFGTGKYLGLADIADTCRQSIYGIWDYGDDSDDSEYLGHIIDRSDGRLSGGLRLAPLQVITRTDSDGDAVRTLNNKAVDFSLDEDLEDGDHLSANNRGSPAPNPQHDAGWFFDFPQSPEAGADLGERVPGDVIIRGGRALVTSFAPDSKPCARGGTSWIYLLSGCAGNDSDADSLSLSQLSSMTAKRYRGRLNFNPVVTKTIFDLTLDQLMLSNGDGRLLMEPFVGERWGKVYWRQNLD